MRITFVTRKFGNVECNSHCDVLHITPIRVARLFLDCNGDFAIKAYSVVKVLYCWGLDCRGPTGLRVHSDASLWVAGNPADERV